MSEAFMNIFISVVSHDHGNVISRLDVLRLLSCNFIVVVKSNVKDSVLNEYVAGSEIIFLDCNYGIGFGANNNLIFNYCLSELGMSINEDIFIVMNPDVVISVDSIYDIVDSMRQQGVMLGGINLFKDHLFTVYDPSVRKFPTLGSFFLSFLGFKNPVIIDKSGILVAVRVDWCAGSFLVFTAKHYFKLKGFDEGYFMYCEDIDICFRSHCMGVSPFYFPQIKALHLAKHNNKKILSKHFLWHVCSIFRFFISKFGLTRMRSCIKSSDCGSQ